MVRIHHFIVALAFTLFPMGCNAVGCAGEDPDQDKTVSEMLVGATEQAMPPPEPTKGMLYGTWTGDRTGGHLSSLVLMSDQRFHAVKAVICVKQPCDAAMVDGKYSLFTKDDRTYFALGEKMAPGVESYEYAVTGDTMRIRPVMPGSEWYSLQRAPAAWCASVRECKVQNLPTGICVGDYACEQSACVWKCASPSDSAVNTGTKTQ